MAGAQELAPNLGLGAACQVMGLWRGAPARQQSRLRRAAFVGPRQARAARPRPPLALDALENQVLLDTLNSERFVDTAPAAVHATLLDEGRYSVLGAHDVPAAGPQRRLSRAEQSARPPGLCQARVAGDRAQPGLVLGHSRARSSGPASTCT